MLVKGPLLLEMHEEVCGENAFMSGICSKYIPTKNGRWNSIREMSLRFQASHEHIGLIVLFSGLGCMFGIFL